MIPSAWKYYLRFYKGSSGALAIIISASAFQSLVVLPMAFLVRYAFDTIIPSGDYQILVAVGIGLFLMNLVNNGITLWTRHLTLETNKKAIRNFREDLVKRCFGFPRSFYTEADLGRLHASIVQDTERLDWMSNALVALLFPSLVVSLGLAGVLIYLSGRLFLMMCLVFPFLFLISRAMKKKIRNKVNAFYRAFENFSRGILMLLQMMDLVRIQTAEKFEWERQKKCLEDVRRTSGAMAWLNAAYESMHNQVSAVSGILILIVGGVAVSRGSMSLGSLLSFYVAMSLLNKYLQIMATSIPHIVAGYESLKNLINMERIEDHPIYTGKETIKLIGTLILKDVHFQYNDKKILESISIELRPGTTTALTGPNGSGKTTIASLLLGFYRPQKGELFADGVSYKNLDIHHLRGQMAMVMQDPLLYPGTILENITYGAEDIPREDVEAAAAMATAHDFITRLPEGYHTVTGERGVLLSGGQRQRICIARALLRKAKILILDEPTNHLDDKNVAQLMTNLKRLEEHPAILLITQNLEILSDCSFVYVLNLKGQIAACGLPGEIMKNTPSIKSLMEYPEGE
jgi:ABC-type bacteriocin/lantibiotic exporter with double-glycine peptidase domain